ncbi:MAG: hypothetical protein ABSG42_02470 [Nitrospirota bacterium]
MSLLEKRLTKEWAQEVMSNEKRLITAILYDLQEVGGKIADELLITKFETLEEFLEQQDLGNSPLDILEGKADRKSNVYVLKGCPMTKLVSSLKSDGKLPEFYEKIADKYKEIHKTKGAILHPFCIVHQVIRALIGEKIKVRNHSVKIFQVACRSLDSGKIVYASEGMERIGLDKEDVDGMIDGNACMYIVKF